MHNVKISIDDKTITRNLLYHIKNAVNKRSFNNSFRLRELNFIQVICYLFVDDARLHIAHLYE